GHGARAGRGEPAEQPGPGAVFRVGVAARACAVSAMDRRAFIGTSAALLAAGCMRPAPPPPGAMLGTRHLVGHRLRDGGLPAPRESRRAKVAIVGAGIAGLSAAWRLRQAGFADFELLELEDGAGGNSRWGESEVSAYPWGAHYIPLPGTEARAVRLLLAELGVLLGDPRAVEAQYDERSLCFTPQERHYRDGSWREGLAPLAGRSARELDEWRRFQERMEQFRSRRG